MIFPFLFRRQKGLVISTADLQDPSLFDDMVEAGLLKLSDNGLTIEQVLGATLQTDVEALTPITQAVLDKVNETQVGGYPAVIPEITGGGHLTGISQWILEENDPQVYGFLLRSRKSFD
ncbi:MAG: proline racemase family protein [Oscillospiraceae bacterium]